MRQDLQSSLPAFAACLIPTNGWMFCWVDVLRFFNERVDALYVHDELMPKPKSRGLSNNTYLLSLRFGQLML